MTEKQQTLFQDRPEEVIKHSAAIQVPMTFSRTERQAWNVMLANAFDDLIDKDIHTISVFNLMRAINADSTRNTEWIKKKIKNLQECKVEFNILGKDEKKHWGSHVLLANVEIKEGTIYYSYGGLLAKRLHNPSIFSKIKLAIQNKLKSKHAQSLYELLLDYRGAGAKYRDGVGTTGKIPLRKVKLIMGVFDKEEKDGSVEYTFKYKENYDFRTKVIDQALEEINRETDIEAWYETYKKGRSLDGFIFYIDGDPTPSLPKEAFVNPEEYLSGEKKKKQKWVRLKAQKMLEERCKENGTYRILQQSGVKSNAFKQDYNECLSQAIQIYQDLSEDEINESILKMEGYS